MHDALGARLLIIRRAFLLEWLTIGWMTIEAAVAIAAALAAHSITLMAFGLDSVIELASAGILIWRLTVELRAGSAFPDGVEVTARKAAAALLFILAVYVVATAGWSLWNKTGAEFSAVGLAVALIAIPLMYALARGKLRIAQNLGSGALRADAIEAITCGYLSVVVVVGLLAQMLFGAWWVDSVTALGIVVLLIKEGREAWRGDECCE
jgi:divalent metal cation (Fe/Co/Zn/Cd) transporter